MLRANDILGPYTLVKKLGNGACGVVWLAEMRTPILTTEVALKIPLDHDIMLEAIRHEAKLWKQASGHPNILPIIEANIYDDYVVIVSEYASGGSLQSWLGQHKGIAPSIDAAVEIASGILAGLHHLHQRGIIHRDLKPGNILFQGETPRLADFGISRILKTANSTASVVGTPAYMAPEAFEGNRSVQTDLWSVGVILYQMLSGQLPFVQSDLASLVRAILMSDPTPLPSTMLKSLEKVVTCALRKDPEKRFRSAAEMRTALIDSNKRQIKSESSQASTEPYLPPTIPSPGPSATPARQVIDMQPQIGEPIQQPIHAGELIAANPPKLGKRLPNYFLWLGLIIILMVTPMVGIVILVSHGQQDNPPTDNSPADNSPVDKQQRVNLGNDFLNQKKFREAEAEFKEAVRLVPDDALAHVRLGYSFDMQEKLKEAEAEFREAVRLDPSYGLAHFYLGRLFEKQGKYAQAEAEFREAARLNSGLQQELKRFLKNRRARSKRSS